MLSAYLRLRACISDGFNREPASFPRVRRLIYANIMVLLTTFAISLSMYTPTTSFYPETPALKFPRAAYTATPESVPTITLTRSDGIWAGPGWFEIFTSESTVYTASNIFEDSSQIVEIGQ